MKMKVWIINHYAGNMLSAKGGRHYSFAKYLKRMGYEPTVFCCNAKHNSQSELYFDDDALWHEHYAEEIDVPFVYVRGRAYT
ncbi:MAG: glycosyltransferase WbuB, partial [Clostridiales bacterium]|nr:glycosyltransferase WbuB [Clostridiales bacterium]